MEGRTLLTSTVLVDGLEFTGDFDQSGQSYTSTGTVLIGYAPTQGEAFNPLLSTDGLVTIPAASGATSFTIAPADGADSAYLDLYTISGTPTFWTTSSSATFDIGSLTSTGQSLGAGTAQAVAVVGVPFDATSVAFTYPADSNTSQASVLLQGNLDFSGLGLSGLTVGVGTAGDGNDVVVTSGSSAEITLTGVEASLDASFTAYGVGISGEITASFDADSASFSFGGSVEFSAEFSTLGTVGVTASLGDDNPVVVDGSVQQISLTPTATFDLFGLSITPPSSSQSQGQSPSLLLEYTAAADQFQMYGSVTATVSSDDSITATLGSQSDPGLSIDAATGDVSGVNMSVSGTFSLLGLGISSPSSNPATLVYTGSNNEYQISGSVSVPSLFDATLTLGTASQPGLTIDDGNWSVNDLQLSLSDVQLGAFEIQQFVAAYTQTSSTEATVDVSLTLAFPQDWNVEGSIQLGIDESTGQFDIQGFGVSWQADSTAAAIPIGDTGMFLTEMGAEVQNFNQPSNLVVSGTMEAVFGQQVTIFGQQASFFQVDGSFFVDKSELSLSATVLFGAVTSGGNTTGILGSGTATMVLDWDDEDYSLDANSSMLDGTFTYDAAFQFDSGNDILLSATADVNVPHGVPLIGGQKLGSLSFLFEYQQPSSVGGQAEGFIAAWTSIDLFVTHVNIGIEYNYVDDTVEILGSAQINALQSQATSTSTTYTYSQSFTVPAGATQGTLEVDWTGNSVLAALQPTTLTVEGPGGDPDVTVTASTTGTITLLQDTGYTTSTQALVGLVGSTTDPYASLSVTNPGTYTLFATFTSDVAPTDTSADISAIAQGPSSSEILVTFTSGDVPSGIEVGDTVSLAGTGVDAYDTSSGSTSPVVQEITGNGVVLNISYAGDATGGSLSGWTLPQFSATWYIPPPTVAIEDAIIASAGSGSAQVTMSAQVASALQDDASIDLYVAPYDATLGTDQAFNGTLVAQDVPLTGATDNGDAQTGFAASALVDMTGLLPTSYYFYAVVNDGTNAPVTSSLTGTDQVVENTPALDGTVSNQLGTGLSGWTVFVDANGDGIQEVGEPSATTDSSGYFGFYASDLSSLLPSGSSSVTLDVVLNNLDSSAFTFASPSDGVVPVTYTGTGTAVADFTVDQQSTIGGVVFLDLNQSGDPDGQTGLSGWTVFLDNDGDGTLDADEPWTLTNAYGAYAFYGVTSGTTYTVALVTNTGASAMYSFEATAVSGTSVYDIAGDPDMLQQTGTLNGGATVGTTSGFGITDHDYAGSDDQVVQLDGSTGYVGVPGTSGLQPGTGGFTVGAWIRGDQAVLGGNNPTIAGTITGGAASGGWSLGLSGSLTFANASVPTSQTSGLPLFVVDTADFNGDGMPDILGIGVDVEILLNTTSAGSTTPTFNPNSYINEQIDVGNATASSVVIADFNGDGMPDFAVSCENEVVVFLNQTTAGSSTLSFATFTLSSENVQWGPLAAVTLNGADQLPDIVSVNNYGQSMMVYMNETAEGADSLTFSSQAVTLGDSVVPTQVVTGDFNGDGTPDLAVAGWDGPLLVLINATTTGATTATFGAPALISLGNASDTASSATAVGDFNGDGADDLAYAAWGADTATDTLYILLSTTGTGSSTATFTTQAFVVGSNPSALLVADLNDDGLPDVAVTNYDDGTVTVLIDTTPTDATAASFSSATYDTASQPTLISTGDFDGDGSTDLAVMGYGTDPLAILLNGTTAGSSSPDFTSSLYPAFYNDALDMVTADFLGDGVDGVASTFINQTAIAMTTVTAQTYLTAEVQENPSSGSGSFSIVGDDSTSLDSDTWYYVAFTYAPDVDSNGDDELTLYVNGVQVAQAIGTGTLPSFANISSAFPFDVLFGAQPGSVVSQFFSGYLDDLSIWPSALTAAQIQALYGGGMAPTYVQTTPTDPDTYATTISGTLDIVDTDNFGELQSATITGSITGTPLGSTTSEALSGWTVQLLDSDGTVVATAETGSSGLYFFFGVMPGTYTVQQVSPLPSGWAQSTPSGTTVVTVSADTDTVPDIISANFTNTQSAQVTGNVYVDANNDGIEDDGEVGAQGVTVYLDGNNNGQLDANEPTAVTQDDGTYAFTGLAPGQYTVRVVESSVGVMTQPSTSSYLANVTAQGTVGGLVFGLSPLAIAPIANVTVAEGSPVSFTVGLAHAESGQPTVFYLAPGAPAGATIDPSTGAFSWTPTTPGTYTITVDAVAAGTPLLTDSQTFTITVTDVPPVVHLGSELQITLGDPFVRPGSFTDPGTDPWTATVDYGDGRGPQPLLLGLNQTFELNHVYQSPGTYSVTVVVDDGEGGIGTAQIAVVVLPNPTPPPPVVVLPDPAPLSSGFGAGRDAFVTTFYRAILGQGPDLASLSHWSGRLHAGTSPLAVARGIWDSPEHQTPQRGQLTPKARFARAFRQAAHAAKIAKRHAALMLRTGRSTPAS